MMFKKGQKVKVLGLKEDNPNLIFKEITFAFSPSESRYSYVDIVYLDGGVETKVKEYQVLTNKLKRHYILKRV
jgi:hypothetical protein